MGDVLLIPAANGTNKNRQAKLPAATVAREWPAVHVAGGWWEAGGEAPSENVGEESADSEDESANHSR